MTEPNLEKLPQWDLTNVYPSLESVELAAASQRLEALLIDLESFLSDNEISRDGSSSGGAAEIANLIGEYLKRTNDAGNFYETVEAYLYGFTSTDSYNKDAARLTSLLDPQRVRLENAETLFKGWLGRIVSKNVPIEDVIKANPVMRDHSFYLTEAVKQSRYLMSEEEEALAAELSMSGSNAWAKLQEVIVSQLKAKMEIEGEVQVLPLSKLVSFVTDPSEDLREKAFRALEEALESAREPLAACLNGVKGSMNVVNIHRGREDAVHDSLDKSRISRKVLETMLASMESAAPVMLRYRKAKAKLLGKKVLEQWDLPAPIGSASRVYSWEEARDFILQNFATYSQKMATLASRAFDERWIDAEPRDGKVVGAFCMRIPAVEESRVLLSFDGRLNHLTTLAHELGHAYHNECLRGKTILQAAIPMTLAETASIFCENIVLDAILGTAEEPEEELAVLDTFLQGASYLTLEVYSRYLFEASVCEQRREAELSADEFCDLTNQVYRQTLKDTIPEGVYRSYDWARLPHYYLPDLSFYNYPYTFGFLFSMGLYQLYKQGWPGFHEAYDLLLAESGMASAVDLGLRMGIDINQPEFWQNSYATVLQRIERYEELVGERMAQDASS